MGWSAARKLRRSVDGLTRVLAIEVLTAARALQMRVSTGSTAGVSAAPGSVAVIELLRSHDASAPGPDRFLSPEIEAVVGLVRTGAVLTAVEEAIGELA
jgi:histidine ammonia-lyase